MSIQVTAVYSSGGGNTRLVVEQVREIFSVHGIEMNLVNAIVAIPDDVIKTQYTLLAAPTYDHGIVHAPFEKLLFAAETISMSGKNYAIIGLGDEKYDHEYTMESASILETFVIDHGGTVFCESLRINKNPIDRLETVVTDRATQAATMILAQYR